MRNFFRNLNRHGVRYLLISGQASVLYGAATFSEDIDIWIAPTKSNLKALIRSLDASKATVYKLTPPLDLDYFQRGHGFHFKLPVDVSLPAFLDVIGKPPRVGSFANAYRRASWFASEWGKIPVVAIRDLVELKKTRRLADYEVISNLARIHLLSQRKKMNKRTLVWGLQHCFRIEDAQWILQTWPKTRTLIQDVDRNWIRLLLQSNLTNSYMERIQTLLVSEIAHYQRLDVIYWAPIIQELKHLRKKGNLLREGLPVSTS